MCGAGKHESRSSAEEGASASERIAIVTGIPTSPCTNPYGDYMLSLSIQNKQVRGAAADTQSGAHVLPRIKQWYSQYRNAVFLMLLYIKRLTARSRDEIVVAQSLPVGCLRTLPEGKHGQSCSAHFLLWEGCPCKRPLIRRCLAPPGLGAPALVRAAPHGGGGHVPHPRGALAEGRLHPQGARCGPSRVQGSRSQGTQQALVELHDDVPQ